MGSHFGVGEFTTHFRTYFSGWIESDVHWWLPGRVTHTHWVLCDWQEHTAPVVAISSKSTSQGSILYTAASAPRDVFLEFWTLGVPETGQAM